MVLKIDIYDPIETFRFYFDPFQSQWTKACVSPRIIFIVLLLQISRSLPSYSQSIPVNFTGWYGFENYSSFKKGKPWGLMGEGFWIRDDVILHQSGLFFRAGLNYNLKSGHRVNTGIAYQYNFPYDAVSLPYNWPDYRLFQQYIIRLPRPKGSWQFRFRIEERWLGWKTDLTQSSLDYYQYQTTFIFRVKKTFVLSKQFYLAAYEEIWLSPSPVDRWLDQNRAYMGGGMILDEQEKWRLEMGYMYQPFYKDSPDTWEKSRINHALRVTLIIDAPLSK
jgi:hypothetical protein